MAAAVETAGSGRTGAVVAAGAEEKSVVSGGRKRQPKVQYGKIKLKKTAESPKL